jgi:hypothetical protein
MGFCFIFLKPSLIISWIVLKTIVLMKMCDMCEIPWGRGQNTTPHCNFNTQILFKSTQNTTLQFGHLNIFLVCLLQNTHHTVLPILGPVITILHFEPVGRVVWGQSTISPPVILWIRGARGQDCPLSVHCSSLSFLSQCHFQVPCISSKAFPKTSLQLTGTCVVTGTCLQVSNAYTKLLLIIYSLV